MKDPKFPPYEKPTIQELPSLGERLRKLELEYEDHHARIGKLERMIDKALKKFGIKL